MAEVINTNTTMNRAQRRRIEKAAEAADRITRSDRMFFDRHVAREHRLRLVSVAELEQIAAMYGRQAAAAPAGLRWVVAVKKLTATARIRRFLIASDASDLDQPENVCRALYETTPKGGIASMLEAMVKTGAETHTWRPTGSAD